MKIFGKLLCAVISILILNNCNKSNDSGKSATISVPDIRPPVQQSLSSSLIGGSTFSLAIADSLAIDYTTTCQTDASSGDPCSSLSTASEKVRCIMKQRLFCKGPVEVLNLLKSVDDRMAEIELRSTGTVPCMDSAAVDSSAELSFPGSASFSHFLQCKDSSIKVAWGKKDETWYLRTANGAAGGLYSINAAQDVEGYMWLRSEDGSFSNSTGLIRLKANKTAGTVEMTGGGVGLGFCSFHYKSDANYIYIIANPNGVGTTCDFDGNSITDASDWVEACVNAGNLSTAASLSNCDSLKAGFAVPTLGRAASGSQAATATAPSGVTLQTFDIGTYLNTLFTSTGTFSSSVQDFTVN